MNKPESKLIKITFEYEDHIYFLEGSELCMRWMKSVNGVLQLHQLRGNKVEGLDETLKHWKRKEKEL